MNRRSEAVPGWFNSEEGDAVATAARQLIGATGTLVEIGTWGGRSTAFLADRLPSWRIITIDDYSPAAVQHVARYIVESGPPLGPMPSDTDIRDPCAAAARHLMAWLNVERLVASAEKVASVWDRGRIDILFHDGEHTAHAVQRDLQAWLVHGPRIVTLHDAATTQFGAAITEGAESVLIGWKRRAAFEAGSLHTYCHPECP